MSNKKTSQKSEKKPDVNIILTAVSTLAAVLSVFSAFISNKIAQESQLPKPSVSYVGQFRDYYDDYKAPCKTQMGYSDWQIDFAVAFDVSNFGGKSVSLVNIEPEKDIETFHPSIEGSMSYEFFGTPERFHEWFDNHYAPSFLWMEQSREKLDYSSPPIKIDIGETRRLVLFAHEKVKIKNDLSPQQALEALYDVNWNTKVSFIFANGDIEQATIRVIHPFSFQVSRTTYLTEFEPCSQP